ncbi:signal protein [Streptomyces sp. ID05-26A]|nr:signal protein [Streptomyces sp. ID05-26A]
MPRLFIAAFALLLAGCAAAPEPAPVSSETTTESSGQLSDQELQAKWWTWAASSPENRNPVVDETGQWCAEDQPKDVWFFAGTFGGTVNRRCQVPAGRPLAGPAVNTVTNCETFVASGKGSITLDGQLVELRRIAPVGITFQAVKDNAVGAPGGGVRAQACGLWAWIPPLSPGEHELRIEGEFGDFRTSARYLLTVSSSD